MPELPEVETVLRGLVPAMKGGEINAVKTSNQALRAPVPPEFASVVTGAVINHLSRRGKYIIVSLNNDHSIIHHLGMSGSFRITEENGAAKLHDHLSYHLKNGKKVIYNDPRRFGMVYLVPSEQVEPHKAFKNMGPDPFSNDFSPRYLKEKFATKKGPVKTVLLDQSIVAGLGNIYVCEALYLAGIHPETAACDVATARIEKLYKAILTVLEDAIQSGGSSLRDHKGVDGTMGYFQHKFSIYGKKGEACGKCDCDVEKTGGVKMIRQAGRSTFYCPQKQKIQV